MAEQLPTPPDRAGVLLAGPATCQRHQGGQNYKTLKETAFLAEQGAFSISTIADLAAISTQISMGVGFDAGKDQTDRQVEFKDVNLSSSLCKSRLLFVSFKPNACVFSHWENN